MPSFKRSFDSNEVKPFEPQNLESSRSAGADSFVRSDLISKAGHFQIDSYVSDQIGLSDMKKNDEKKAFDGEVLRYVQKIKDGAFEEAYQKGLLAGEQKAKEEALADAGSELKEQMESFSTMLNKLSGMAERAFSAQEEEIIDFCMFISEKVMQTALEKNPELIKHNIKKVLKVVESVKSDIIVKLSKTDYEFVTTHTKEMSPQVDLSKVKLEMDETMAAGDVIVESAQGTVDGTMASRFEQVKHLLLNVEE